MWQLVLILATFLCSLVAGFLLAFAVVVMPGLGRLGDRDFIRGFQVIDGVIQNNQPVFMLVWIGSVLALLTAIAFAFGEVDGAGRSILVGAALIYLLGVHLPTLTINIPLNNQLQRLDVDQLDDAALARARREFESRWNTWNVIRTAIASLATVLLMIQLYRL